MKPMQKLRAIPGVGLALIIVTTGSVGAYAFTNWFGGDVMVRQANSSVLSVDLSQCKGNLPPGVATTADRHDVQFKIVGQPHISAADLQHKLLAQCEYNSILEFYKGQSSMKDVPSIAYTDGTIKAASEAAVTVQYLWGGRQVEKDFHLADDVTVYDQGQPVTLHDLHPGDKVIFAAALPGTQSVEGVDPFATDLPIRSFFKTQYDPSEAPGASKKDFYEVSKIMPLDWYNQTHQASPGAHK